MPAEQSIQPSQTSEDESVQGKVEVQPKQPVIGADTQIPPDGTVAEISHPVVLPDYGGEVEPKAEAEPNALSLDSELIQPTDGESTETRQVDTEDIEVNAESQKTESESARQLPENPNDEAESELQKTIANAGNADKEMATKMREKAKQHPERASIYEEIAKISEVDASRAKKWAEILFMQKQQNPEAIAKLESLLNQGVLSEMTGLNVELTAEGLASIERRGDERFEQNIRLEREAEMLSAKLEKGRKQEAAIDSLLNSIKNGEVDLSESITGE